MLRPLFLLLLIAGFTQIPQVLEAQIQNLSPTRSNTPLEGKMYAKVYPNYDALRRGAEMKVAVVPFRQGHGPYNGQLPIFLRSAPSLTPEPVCARLDLEAFEGLSVGAVEPPGSRARKYPFSSQPVEVLTPAFKNHPVAFREKVTASSLVPVGNYVLHGKLIYREVTDRGISEPQIIPVEIPIHVVERDAKVNKDRYWTFDQSQAKETTTLVLLSPLLVPLVALGGAVCAISLAAGGHCNN